MHPPSQSLLQTSSGSNFPIRMSRELIGCRQRGLVRAPNQSTSNFGASSPRFSMDSVSLLLLLTSRFRSVEGPRATWCYHPILISSPPFPRLSPSRRRTGPCLCHGRPTRQDKTEQPTRTRVERPATAQDLQMELPVAPRPQARRG